MKELSPAESRRVAELCGATELVQSVVDRVGGGSYALTWQWRVPWQDGLVVLDVGEIARPPLEVVLAELLMRDGGYPDGFYGWMDSMGAYYAMQPEFLYLAACRALLEVAE